MNISCMPEFDPSPLLQTSVIFNDKRWLKEENVLVKARSANKSGGGLIRAYQLCSSRIVGTAITDALIKRGG